MTPYIAEFFNTLSSVPIVLFALTALYIGFHEGFRKRFLIPCFFTALVGIGSIVFHGTLQYWGQAMDELFMVYAATAYMTMIAFSDRTIPARFVVPAALALDAAFTGAYVYLRDGPFFVVFCVIFGLLSTWLCYASLQMHRRTFSPILQRLFWAGQLTWLGGFGIFWFPDKLACEWVQRFHLHAWFHLCVATAPLLFLTHATHCFYSAELAVVTGKVSDNTGKLIPAPPEVLRYISERALREHIAVDVAAVSKTIAVPQLFWSWIPIIPVSVCARAHIRSRSTTSALHHTNPLGRLRSLSKSFTSRSSSVSTTSAIARISPGTTVFTVERFFEHFPFSSYALAVRIISRKLSSVMDPSFAESNSSARTSGGGGGGLGECVNTQRNARHGAHPHAPIIASSSSSAMLSPSSRATRLKFFAVTFPEPSSSKSANAFRKSSSGSRPKYFFVKIATKASCPTRSSPPANSAINARTSAFFTSNPSARSATFSSCASTEPTFSTSNRENASSISPRCSSVSSGRTARRRRPNVGAAARDEPGAASSCDISGRLSRAYYAVARVT